MYPSQYDLLIRSRQETLLREAEHERLIATARQRGTMRTPRKASIVRLGSALMKRVRKLEHFGMTGGARA